MTRVLFAPHSDDETLFAFYTVLRYQPRIVVCFPSERDYGETNVRTLESREAMRLAGVEDVEQWYARSVDELWAAMIAYEAKVHPSEVWAPHPQSSHPHHVMVGVEARKVFGDRVRTFHTYDADGKVRTGRKVAVEDGWADRKRQALACYRTQLTHPRARIFYDEQRFELDEYTSDPEPGGVRHIEYVQVPEDGQVVSTPEAGLDITTPEAGAPEPETRAGRKRGGRKERQAAP